MRILLSILIIIFLFSFPVNAADIKISGNEPYVSIDLNGEIEKGDFRKMINVIKSYGSIPGDISVSSSGGDVLEAMQIGKFARKALLTFGASRECNSACIFICAGTTSRFVDPYGKFGLHRPYFEKAYFAGLSANEADKKYNELAQLVKDYLKDMEVPQVLIDRIFKTSSDSIDQISADTLASIVGHRLPSYDEWIIAKCGSLTDAEWRDLRNIDTGGFSVGYKNYLTQKRDSIRGCEKRTAAAVRKEIFKSL